MKFYLIAGERSGDLHASNLVRALQKRFPDAEYRALGGELLEAKGVSIFKYYSEIAVMGIMEVILSIRKISKALKATQRDVFAYRPDLLILIDYAGFNLRMAHFAKNKGIKVAYYILPKIWAWNQKRAWKIKQFVDLPLAILPFEKTFYEAFGIQAKYVGNPVQDAVKNYATNNKEKVAMRSNVIALLPGSRRQELEKIMPIFVQLAAKRQDINFSVAAINSLPKQLYTPFMSLPNVKLYFEDTYHLLSQCSVAVVTSGTATLEAALLGAPQVVVYKTRPFTAFCARLLIKVKYISLVNLVAEKALVKELIQEDCTAQNMSEELDRVLTFRSNEIKQGYKEIEQKLGEESASEGAAKAIHSFLGY